MENRIIICAVQPDSAAHDAGIEPGDVLLSINGQKIEDVFDYRFLATDSNLLVEIEKKNGEVWEIEVEKDEYEDLGLEFEDPLISGAKSCTNKCIFCFIDQLPKGMRESLYFKDDDSRLSFLSGNYVTLTNISDEELERIIRYKMSPVNVSVHTTNPELRVLMLRNRFAGNVLERIRKLTDGGIKVNAQIVLCRGINDKEELNRTIKDLSDLYPGLESISVVPVGLTKWREGLYRLVPYDRESSLEVVSQVTTWQQKLLNKFGSRIVYLADEFYIMANKDLPPCEEYEDFPQIENGVGLMSLLLGGFYEFMGKHGNRLDSYMNKKREKRRITIATGVCPHEYIKQMAQFLEKRYNNLKIEVVPIKNNFFGENVTVTGLITGCDLVSQLEGRDLGDEVLISKSMLRAGEEIFLDDYTVDTVGKKLGRQVVIVENDAEDFILKILGIRKKRGETVGKTCCGDCRQA